MQCHYSFIIYSSYTPNISLNKTYLRENSRCCSFACVHYELIFKGYDWSRAKSCDKCHFSVYKHCMTSWLSAEFCEKLNLNF